MSSGGQSLGKEQVETEMKGRRKGEKPCKKMPVVGHGRVPAGISGMPGSYSPYLIFNPNKRYYSSPNLFLTGVCVWGCGGGLFALGLGDVSQPISQPVFEKGSFLSNLSWNLGLSIRSVFNSQVIPYVLSSAWRALS